MSKPIITSVYPADTATAISISDVVVVTFDQALDPVTVSPLTIILADTTTYTAVPCTVTYNSTTYACRLAPTSYLAGSTEYIVTIVGRDTSTKYGTAIANEADERFETTTTFTFTTGTGVTSGTIAPLPDTAISTVATGYQPTDYLSLVSSDPLNYDSNISTAINYMVITFNYMPNMTSGYIEPRWDIPPTASGMARIEYFVEVTGRHMLYATPGYSTKEPGYSFVENGRNLIIYPSGGLQKNFEYTINVKSGYPGLSSWPLAADTSVMFTTEMEPMYTTPDVIRLNPVGPLIQNIPDDTINRMIYEHSIEASSLYPGGVGPNTAIPTCVHEYVTCATKLDALQAALAKMISGTGGVEKKTLGDMSIQYNLADISRAARDLQDPLQKCKDRNKQLIPNGCARDTAKVVVKSETDPRRPITNTSWRRIPNNLFNGMRDDRPTGPTNLGF